MFSIRHTVYILGSYRWNGVFIIRHNVYIMGFYWWNGPRVHQTPCCLHNGVSQVEWPECSAYATMSTQWVFTGGMARLFIIHHTVYIMGSYRWNGPRVHHTPQCLHNGFVQVEWPECSSYAMLSTQWVFTGGMARVFIIRHVVYTMGFYRWNSPSVHHTPCCLHNGFLQVDWPACTASL